MKACRLFLTFLVAGAPASVPHVAAGQTVPDVTTSVDTTLISVGDRVTMTVDVEHPTGSSVAWPDSLSLAPFEVLGAQVEPPIATEDGLVTRLRLVLTAFELGDVEIPRFQLEVVGADAGVTPLETDAFAVTVASVGLDDGGGIRGIRGPLSIARSWLLLTPWLILLIAAGLLAAWWLRRRGGGAEERTLGRVKIPRPPHEVALEALDALERAGLLERGEIKAFHVEVSEIIRTYVEDRFAVRALEMTSAEVLDGLWRVGIEGALLDDFRAFLERCDLVKFAKLRPTPEASGEMLSLARKLVEETRPRMIEVPEDDLSDLGEVEPAVAAVEQG